MADFNDRNLGNGAGGLYFDPEAVRCVPEGLARKHRALPLGIVDGGQLRVAMPEPINLLAADDIQSESGKPVIPVATDAGLIDRLLDEAYSVGPRPGAGGVADAAGSPGCVAGGSAGAGVGARGVAGGSAPGFAAGASALSGASTVAVAGGEASGRVSGGAAKAAGGRAAAGGWAGVGGLPGDDASRQSPVRVADSILESAVAAKASDVHIEPFEGGLRVRFRVDGSLLENPCVPPELCAPVSTRLKVLAGMDIAERRLPQDGRIDMRMEGRQVDFRVSTLPTVHGEKIEIRILDRSRFAFERGMLGFTDRENQLIDAAMAKPHGMTLVTGPTGSGKTTTIYTLLAELNRPSRNLVTIEDPVEYVMDGANQVQVNQKAGLTFASGLRSVLRQDPDVIMVGEIRDEETAAMAIRSAITGHIVLSTLHTNDAARAVVRLMDMGVEPYLIGEALSCVIGQRLVRVLCPACKAQKEADSQELRILRADHPVVTCVPVGCLECGGTGYRGRRAIHEVFGVGSEIRGEIERRAGMDALRRTASEAGMTTLFDSCRALALSGETSVQELAGAAYEAG